MAKTLRILGVDPGVRRAGFAVADVDVSTRSFRRVIEIGILETERNKDRQIRKTSDDLIRARYMAAALKGLVSRHKVNAIAYEIATSTPYTYPTLSFGIMLGIVASLDVPIVEILAPEMKAAVTGKKDATKRQIVAWALGVAGDNVDWPLSGRKNSFNLMYQGHSVAKTAEHPADALGLIYTAAQSQQLQLACTIAGI